MWSVAALTTAILVGAPFFANGEDSLRQHDPEKAVFEAASRWNPAQFKDDPAYQILDYKVKDFLNRLFVLDEDKRMEVGSALRHQWFSHEPRKKYIDDQYQRAISAWTPTRARLDYMEHLNIFMENRRVLTDVCHLCCLLHYLLTRAKAEAMPPPPRPSSVTTITSPPKVEPRNTGLFSRHFPQPGVRDSYSAGLSSSDVERRPCEPHRNLRQDLEQKRKSRPSMTHSCSDGDGAVMNDDTSANFRDDSQERNRDAVDIDLHLAVGTERRGFRSAKSFARAVAKRRCLEA